MEEEIWRPVVGFEGLYEVSSWGRIKSLGCGKHKFKERIMHPGKTANKGYLQVELRKEGKVYHCGVHRLVAQAFPDICGKWFEGCDVNHKDETPSNCRADNLEVCTRLYNINYGTGIQRRAKSQLNRKDCAKSIAQYTLEGTLITIYPSIAEAKRQTGACNILYCCKGIFKQSGGYIWKYA